MSKNLHPAQTETQERLQHQVARLGEIIGQREEAYEKLATEIRSLKAQRAQLQRDLDTITGQTTLNLN